MVTGERIAQRPERGEPRNEAESSLTQPLAGGGGWAPATRLLPGPRTLPQAFILEAILCLPQGHPMSLTLTLC